MADPRYEITAVDVTHLDAGGFADIVWRGPCTDSTGFEHRHGKGYSLMLGAGESGADAMSARLAAARTEADVMALVHADARRVLAEFEARVTGAAPTPVHFVVPAPTVLDDAEPYSDPSPPPIDNDP